MTMTTMTTPLRRPEEVSLDGPARPAPGGAGHGRRRFNAGYKLAILEEYERLSDPGAKGALLRREGLYSSHIVEWRRAREVGALAGLGPKARRPKASALEKEVERLRRPTPG
jgi:transposase-like protein